MGKIIDWNKQLTLDAKTVTEIIDFIDNNPGTYQVIVTPDEQIDFIIACSDKNITFKAEDEEGKFVVKKLKKVVQPVEEVETEQPQVEEEKVVGRGYVYAILRSFRTPSFKTKNCINRTELSFDGAIPVYTVYLDNMTVRVRYNKETKTSDEWVETKGEANVSDIKKILRTINKKICDTIYYYGNN